MTNYYAVITTHNRHAYLNRLIACLLVDGVTPVVIDNASTPPVKASCPVIRDMEQPPNLSRLWNVGLDWVSDCEGDSEHFVAVLNDDILTSPSFVQMIASKMDKYEVDLGFPNQRGYGVDVIDRSPPATCKNLEDRMTGYAFVLRGSAHIRANEDLRWWYGDQDVEMKARKGKGTVLVSGITVEHFDPNGYTNRSPTLSAQAARDRETFRKIWGFHAF